MMSNTKIKKPLLFSSARFVASLGMLLGVVGGTVLHANDAGAEGPAVSTDKQGNYWCSFDTASGGRTNQGPFNGEVSKKSCIAACKRHEHGQNCDEAVTTPIPDPIEAPSAREKQGN